MGKTSQQDNDSRTTKAYNKTYGRRKAAKTSGQGRRIIPTLCMASCFLFSGTRKKPHVYSPNYTVEVSNDAPTSTFAFRQHFEQYLRICP